MDLTDIASISGKGGLFRVKSRTQNGAIVEPIDQEGKKFPVQQHQPLALLEEVSIYSKKTDEIPLKDIFAAIKEKYDNELPVSSKDNEQNLREFFNEVAPDHDDKRVYPSDIKKVVKWYSLLREKEII